MPETIAEIELQASIQHHFKLPHNRARFLTDNMRKKEKRKKNLNRPSGSNGPRHQVGASLRNGPESGELKVQACILSQENRSASNQKRRKKEKKKKKN